MAMISAFSKLILLFITAHVSSALNSPVPVVHTVPSVTLISGKEGTLTCKYNRTVLAVYWRYESTASAMELLVALDNYFEVGERSGPGFDEGRFNITDDHSLIIHNVKVTDEGTYICEVSDYETGQEFSNHTDVTTVVTAERPFIRIEKCKDDVSAESCFLHTTPDDRIIQLTCTVVGAKPLVDLTWDTSISSEHWKQVMNASILSTRDRGNGIFDQRLTVNVETSYIKSDKQLFTCFGKGLAVDGVANCTIAVYHSKVSNVTWTVVAVVISVVVCTLLSLVIIGVWCKVRDKRPGQKTSEEMVKEIRGMKADEPVYLGVLGDKGAGKKSFIDSLLFLVQEKDGSTRPKSSEWTYATDSTASQMWEYTAVISEGLRIRKQRDDVPMIKPEEIPDILMSNEKDNSSSRADKNKEIGDLIHLPIFVFDISNEHDGDNPMQLLRKLAEAVHDHILQYPMIVLTKASTPRKDLDAGKLIRKFIRKTKMPRENIFVTFQLSNSRSEQLDFILKCVAKVDDQKKDIKTPLPGEEKSNMPFLNDTTF